MRTLLFFFLLFSFSYVSKAQLKFVVEDFEGFSDGSSDLKANGLFTYGNIKATVDYKMGSQRDYNGERYLRLNREGKASYGGWGKGISLNIQLDSDKDNFNFYVCVPASSNDTIKIELQEDDNGNATYEKESDDAWIYSQAIEKQMGGGWQLISIPLNKFKDNNQGGDGVFNVNYEHGKLQSIIFSFSNSHGNQTWLFDFICFSQGKLPTGKEIFDAPSAAQNDFCNLGVWSKEGNTADFTDIAINFENNFKYGSEKKLGVVHFFQPFATDGGAVQNHYPSVERVNRVIKQGYIPMITLEDHFVNAHPTLKQPNLYSIIEGHFDNFFSTWANQIKQVDGLVLLRILHEFNGDWYPWCIANNDKNPELLIKAFRYIHTIFKTHDVTNVKFIWCPNSMSLPQEKWNFIMDAYPGDEYVDYVGLDIYNGAGQGASVWRSFRKEGIENYFILTEYLPDKPLFVCETASRERKKNEPKAAQDKAGWIKQMSMSLKSDMSKIKLLIWFNEKESFKINSSKEAQGAFLDYILKDDYFKSGTKYMYPLLGH